MNRPEKVIYTAKVHTTGGRVGASRSDDGRLEVKLSRPGTPGAGTNPEQLFAAGWSACYESAMELVARRMKIALPADLAVDGRLQCRGASQYQPARRRAGCPRGVWWMPRTTCVRYSRATHGNIAVETKLV
jgi:lipoyl-dependent peroxiredoxin